MRFAFQNVVFLTFNAIEETYQWDARGEGKRTETVKSSPQKPQMYPRGE